MMRAPWLLVSGWLGLLMALLCPAARADAPVTLLSSVAGYVSFTGIEATMRTGTANMCQVVSSTTTLSKNLSGIPSGAKVISARLYWAGSGTTVDQQVTFDGNSISADKTYTAAYTTGGITYNYFSAAADVTSIVAVKGNGKYNFSGLTIANGSPWCAVEGVLGGFALLVVYSDPATQPFRVLNIYEGLQYTRNSSLTLNLSNFRVPNPMGSASGRIGHITWEGDDALQAQGEDLALNGTVMTDKDNPTGNQFNSKSNIDGDTESYGIDFDGYTIAQPILQPDQTTATTVYSSGQDLVLLSAEIVAVPNVPTDDLAITMTRTGTTTPGQTVTYTLQVQNNGPNDELGPITVTDTLPTGMTLVSATGTGWTCTSSAPVVTCTRTGVLAGSPVTAASPITIKVSVAASVTGTYTNVATVAGSIFDNISSNNTDTDTSSDPTVLVAAGMILTDKPCTDGVALTSPSSPCKRVTWLVANTATDMYVTNLGTNGVPLAVTTKGSGFTYNAKFSLTCVNPGTAGTATLPKYGGNLSFKCVSNGVTPALNASNTWTTVALTFAKNSPSATLSGGAVPRFLYPDVGLLQLNFTDTDNTTIRTARFVSQPSLLTLAVKRPAPDNTDNPGVNAGNTDGFVRAGEPFRITIAAQMNGGGAPPSFGKESPPVTVGLTQSVAPAVSGGFSYQGAATFAGNFTYAEVGNVDFTSRMTNPLQDYLGSGQAVPGQTQTVGRFYPAYFETITTPNFPCLTRMKCPTTVSGATYSGQSFKVTVIPKGVDGTVLKNYINPFAKPIALTGVTAPGSTTGVFGGIKTEANTSPVTIGVATSYGTELSTRVRYNLSTPYDSGTPRTVWSPPTPLYINALAPQTRVGTLGDPVNSNRGSSATSAEGGVLVVNGRLQVPNGYGSELLRLPLQLTAQYWTGTAWEVNSGFNSSPLDISTAVGASASFTKCTGNLVCSPSLLDTTSPVQLVTGVGTVWLKAPGTGVSGSTMVKMIASPTYLPSTMGKAVYGIYKSRVIYIREVY